MGPLLVDRRAVVDEVVIFSQLNAMMESAPPEADASLTFVDFSYTGNFTFL